MASRDRGLKEVKENIGAIAGILKAVGKPAVEMLMIVLPIAIKYTSKAYGAFQKLPTNCMLFVYGSILCFFGGTFPVMFAAIEAAEQSGRATFVQALTDLSEEAMIIIEESKKDSSEDKDGDGKIDVDQMSNSEYMTRKTKLVLRKMNPEKVDKAISSMYKVWLAIAAVLSIEFARTIAMALAIADFLKKPLQRFVCPALQIAIPDEYDKWVPVVLGWIAKSIAMSIAWKVQTVISAVASALTGGLMMARAAYQFCLNKNFTLGGLVPKDHSDSLLDEGLSYLFAGLGFFFQFTMRFELPFPLNFLLWPFRVGEYYLRWTITKAA